MTLLVGSIYLIFEPKTKRNQGYGHQLGGVHSHFGDNFEDLTKTKPKVDMWTSCSLLIIKRVDVHRFWGGRAWVQAEAATPSFAPVTARKANLGEPFQCPLHSVLYGTCPSLQTKKTTKIEFPPYWRWAGDPTFASAEASGSLKFAPRQSCLPRRCLLRRCLLRRCLLRGCLRRGG